MHNLLGLGLCFESHIPENAVDHINSCSTQTPTSQRVLVHCSWIKTKIKKLTSCLKQVQMENGSYKPYIPTLASSSSSNFVQGLFAGGVPYRHIKVFDQERTNDIVQDIEQEIPATEWNEKWGHWCNDHNALTPGLELTLSPSSFVSSWERTN